LDFFIFKLMREAREAGKRLSDVVEVCWQHLSQAKHPISYLRALLASTTDFGHQRRAKAAARSAAQAAVREREETRATLQALDGQTFIDRRGETRYTVTDAGMTLTVYNVAEGVARRAVGQWTQSFVKAVKQGQIAVQRDTGRTRHDADAVVEHAVKDRQPVASARKITPTVADHLSQLRRLCLRA
jgi:hypothetical protein